MSELNAFFKSTPSDPFRLNELFESIQNRAKTELLKGPCTYPKGMDKEPADLAPSITKLASDIVLNPKRLMQQLVHTLAKKMNERAIRDLTRHPR